MEKSRQSRFERPLYLQVIIVGGFIITVFTLFLLARSIYRDSFQVGGYIRELNTSIANQKTAIADQRAELQHVQTPEYLDKQAKELLGLKQPGEEVLVLTSDTQNIDDLIPQPVKPADELAAFSVPRRWARFLFGI